MKIKFDTETLAAINKRGKGTLGETLGIEIIDIGADFIKGKMPVDFRTIQPAGILHGGASVALAETLGSIASNLIIDNTTHFCVGLDINANHIRAVSNGFVYGVAIPIHIGKTTHIWEIKLTNKEGKITCISRLTMAILTK